MLLACTGVNRRRRSKDYDESEVEEIETATVDVLSSLVCPEQAHPANKSPCRCIYLLRLEHYLKDKVLSCWHLDNELPLSSFELNQPSDASRGGQGVVFYVHEVGKPENQFALKYKDRRERSRKTWTLEKREVDILRKVQHPFIVKLLHYYETTMGLFMAMEYLSKGSLWSHIHANGVMPESTVIYFVAAVVDALEFLHEKNIMFRDLKAENVVLDCQGRPRLIDFGLSKEIEATGDNSSMTRYDFVSYLAPEIYRKSEKYGLKVDSWGVGFLLTELLLGFGITQDIPWEVDNASYHLSETWKLEMAPQNAEKLSTTCLDLVHSLLSRQPEDRPTMTETKLDPFFGAVCWATLKETLPPLDPFSPEVITYQPKPAPSPLEHRDDSKVEKKVEEGMKEYKALPNVPTICANSNWMCLPFGSEMRMKFISIICQNKTRDRPSIRNYLYRTIGNL